jgi:hypothetical protein
MSLIKNLQDKPDHIRNRIFLGSSAVVVVAVVSLWFISFKHQVQNISGASLTTSLTQNLSQNSTAHYLAVDGADDSNGKTVIYFSVNNDTSDILSFSQNDDITLSVDGKDYKPSSLQTRQQQAFVQKILSNTQVFGIATFDVSGKSDAELTFDNLYFEQNPSNIFKETLDIDFGKLSKPVDIRD